jgi:hypothetical protein
MERLGKAPKPRWNDEKGQGGPGMATVSVRYIVDDVDAAIEFYCQSLGVRGGDASGTELRDDLPW